MKQHNDPEGALVGCLPNLVRENPLGPESDRPSPEQFQEVQGAFRWCS